MSEWTRMASTDAQEESIEKIEGWKIGRAHV